MVLGKVIAKGVEGVGVGFGKPWVVRWGKVSPSFAEGGVCGFEHLLVGNFARILIKEHSSSCGFQAASDSASRNKVDASSGGIEAIAVTP